ncbi:MAG: hypothetical protein IKF38_05955 [Clostridia bacterium]|nr:hypothetical protein [Clostridia bacterium]
MYKKKVLIGIIIILCIIILTNVTILFLRKKEIAQTNSLTKIGNIEKNLDTPTILENEIEQPAIDELIENTSVTATEMVTEENTIPNVETPETKNVEKNYTEKTAKQVITKDANNNVKHETNEKSTIQNVENTTTSQVQEIPQNVPIKIQEPVKSIVEEPKQEPVIKQEEKPAVVEEKSVRNDSMINQIKQIIENNPSSNMQKYCYTIQVDSSIKELTNQFTYTESRVINAIKHSCGIIKIYAEDYYKNGQFIMTECYIL